MKLTGAFGIAMLALSTPALAKQIPVDIRWQGTQPNAISMVLPGGGLRQLTYDAPSGAFRGTVEITGDVSVRQSFVVAYQGYNHPIDVRAHRFLPGIEFMVSLQPAGSCTLGRVQTASRQTHSIPDALASMAAAGQLLSIARPNDCPEDIEGDAIEARYLQSVRLSHLSRGFFMISPQFTEAYRASAGLANRNVDAQIAGYADEEAGLEAVQLADARQEAQEAGDFGLAADINQAMYARIETDVAAREAFARKGLRSHDLVGDTQWLRDMAATRAVTSNQRVEGGV